MPTDDRSVGAMTQASSEPAGLTPWRLLIVVNVPWFFVMHRLPIALMARDRGVDVHVACGEGSGREDIEAHGLPSHPLPLTRTPFAPLRDLRATRALARLYRELRPDIVHHVTLKPVIYGSVAARMAGVPAVVNAFAGLGYTFSGESFAARARRWLITRMLASSLELPRQTVVFENRDDLELLTASGAVPRESALVISGVGVDTNEYRESEEVEGPVCILLAGRMLKEKGVEYFVEAARHLRARGRNARFLLIGTPDPFNPGTVAPGQLEEWTREGVIEWQGFRRDMPHAIAQAHIVCLPTFYREGVPRILMEGAACGRALVATDMPGCRDIVRDGLNGLLVPPHDVEALTNALDRLILDPVLRRRMARAGRVLAEECFALPRVLEQFWRLYMQLRQAGVPGAAAV
jgi:glycosyltransferase involved in cell wall biosynthesis